MTLKPLIPAVLLTVSALAAPVPPQDVRVITTSDIQQGGVAGGAGMAPGAAPMKPGNGVIFGTVTEADSNRPVGGAIVSINLPGSQVLRVMADGQGRFGFRDLPPGAFSVTSTRPGWVDGSYGRTRPAGPNLPLILAEGDRVSGVIVPMWRFATIAGTVTDESGDPLVRVPVRVLKRTTVGGKTTVREYQNDSTDDRGNYRIGQLEPGEYLVVVPFQPPSSETVVMSEGGAARDVMVRAVSVAVDTGGGGGGGNWVAASSIGDGPSAGIGEDGRPLAFTTQFYPNSPVSTRATVLTVSSGEERSGIDFQLRAGPTSKVSGTAMGPDGPVQGLQINLVPSEADANAISIETITGFSDGQGRFTIEGVPPGNYVLRATRMPRQAGGMGQVFTYSVGGATVVENRGMPAGMPPSAQQLPNNTLWTEMPLAVGNKDLDGVSVSLRNGVRMTGTVQFNGTAEKPVPQMLQSIGIILEPADPKVGVQNGTGRIDPTTGTFSTVGVPPGRYFVRIRAGVPNWTFQSAMIGGRDASVVPIEIESNDLGGVVISFTDRPTEFSGTVTGDGTLEGTTVILYPADQAAWTGYGTQSRRLQAVRADKQGNFKMSAMPAGDYLAVAMPDKMANDWQNPKFLQSMAGNATRVHINEGNKANASLQVIK